MTQPQDQATPRPWAMSHNDAGEWILFSDDDHGGSGDDIARFDRERDASDTFIAVNSYDALREALRGLLVPRAWEHTKECELYKPYSQGCDCGYRERFAAAEAALALSEPATGPETTKEGS